MTAPISMETGNYIGCTSLKDNLSLIYKTKPMKPDTVELKSLKTVKPKSVFGIFLEKIGSSCSKLFRTILK